MSVDKIAKAATESPKKKVGRPPKPATVEDVIRLMERLSPEEKERMQRLGGKVIEGTEGLDDPTESVWGLRCAHCNGVALRFLGATWNGYPVPPAGTRLRDLSWTKDQGDPNSTNCQHCGAGPSLGQGGGIRPPGPPHYGVVLLTSLDKLPPEHAAAIRAECSDDAGNLTIHEDYEKVIAHAYSPQEKRRVKGLIASKSSELQGTSQSFTDRNESVDRAIDAVAQKGYAGVEGTDAAEQAIPGSHGGRPAGHARAVMEQIAEQSGLNAAAASLGIGHELTS